MQRPQIDLTVNRSYKSGQVQTDGVLEEVSLGK